MFHSYSWQSFLLGATFPSLTFSKCLAAKSREIISQITSQNLQTVQSARIQLVSLMIFGISGIFGIFSNSWGIFGMFGLENWWSMIPPKPYAPCLVYIYLHLFGWFLFIFRANGGIHIPAPCFASGKQQTHKNPPMIPTNPDRNGESKPEGTLLWSPNNW